MYVVLYHNEHEYETAGGNAVFGPYTLDEAKVTMGRIREQLNVNDEPDDPHFEFDEDGTSLAYSDEDSEVCSEIWAEIVLLQS